MDLYAIRRRNAWRTPADLPVSEVIKVANTVVVEPDPARHSAARK